MKIKIANIAHYLPSRIVNNVEISGRYPQAGTPEEIFRKTGIKERRYSDELTTVDMATKAVEALLTKTGILPTEIDLVIVGTLSPDFFSHSCAEMVIKNIGAVKAFGYDIVAACPSFLFGINVAIPQMEARSIKRAVVIGADRMSRTINAFDYKTGILFGDAAAAVLLEQCDEQEMGINGGLCKVQADNIDDVYFKTPFNSADYSKEKFEIEGSKVYKHGVTLTCEVIREYLKSKDLELSDFKYIIPHQANMRMITEIASILKIPVEMFLMNIETVGNTAGASVPLCLSQKLDERIIGHGERLLLVSFGAGYTLSIVDTNFLIK